MKIVIYALGTLFEHYSDKIDWRQVVALSDKNVMMINKKYNVPVIHPSSICNMNYDYIVVFSNNWFDEIRQELIGQYYISKDKIIPYNEIISEDRTTGIVEFYREFCRNNMCNKILDFGMSEIPKVCLYKKMICSENGVMDGIISNRAIYNENIYDHIYLNYNDCDERYDVIIFGLELESLYNILMSMIKKSRYILFHTEYLLEENNINRSIIEKLKKYGTVKYISNEIGIFWIIDTQEYKLVDDVSIYVVVHKDYNFKVDKLYRPLCVGDYHVDNYLTEHCKENIAYLNRKINECTALYWIWKNTDTKYVGLNHYRRYFYNDGNKSMDNYLDIYHISKIFKSYDIIMPEVYALKCTTIQEQLKESMDRKLFQIGYSLVRNKIEKKCPDYLQAFDSVMSGYSMFPCNIFVTKREVLNKYCEWLFSFIIEAAEEIDIEGYDAYSQRVIGFIAERMWTVWLRKNSLKIKELPYTMIR